MLFMLIQSTYCTLHTCFFSDGVPRQVTDNHSIGRGRTHVLSPHHPDINSLFLFAKTAFTSASEKKAAAIFFL